MKQLLLTATLLLSLIANNLFGQTNYFTVSGGGALPAGWSAINNVTSEPIDKSSYYMVQPGSPGDELITASYDLCTHSSATFSVDIGSFGSGTHRRLKVEVSLDGGATYTQTYFTNVTTSATETTIVPLITISPVSSAVVLKLSVDATTGRGIRMQNLILDGNGTVVCATACTPPSTQPTSINFTSITDTDMTINWVGGNGSNSLVVVSESTAVTSTPGNIAYTANTTFALGDDLGASNYVVYNGTGNTVTVTGLTANTTYHIAIFEFDTAPECYNTTTPTINSQITDCAATPSPITGLTPTVGNTQVSLTWTNPTACFDEVLVVAEPGTIGFSPTGDGTAYTANAVYGSGTCVNCAGANTEYAVYKGTGTSVTVTGLTNGDSYCFKVWVRFGTNWSVQTVNCGNIPTAAVSIPDNGCGSSDATMTFDYTGTGPIADIDISIFIEHTFRADLQIEVESPTGTIVQLISSNGGGANNLEATFDDAAAGTISTTDHVLDAAIDETVQSSIDPLSNFNGENPNGTWILRVCDDANADIGILNNWFPTIIESCTATHTVTGFTPTSGPELTIVTVTGTGFTSASTIPLGGVAATVTFVSATTLLVEIPIGATTNTIDITESACPVSTASNFTLIENTGGCAGATVFTDLIISEIYDSDANNVWHIELFNPTGSAIDLAAENYTIERYATGFTGAPSRIISLSGIIPAGGVFLLDIGTTASPCPNTFDFTESGAGINEDDGIMLVHNGTNVDAAIAPGSTGYSILRDPSAAGPTTTYNAADWTTNLLEDCGDLGTFVLPTPPPTIDTDPADVFACAEDMTTAASAGNGGALTYQWLYNDGTSVGWSNVTVAAFPTLTVSGETTVNLSITGVTTDIVSIDNYQFYCEVTESGTCSAPSKAAQFKARTVDDPQIITALLNSCASCGTEGENEYVILSIGDEDVVVNTTNIVMNHGSTSPASTTYTDSYSANVAVVNALNAENAVNGCAAPVFFDAVTAGTIPANSNVILMDPNICTTVYDFSNFCGAGPIYLLFSDDASWASTGNFLNNGGVRYFSLSITDVNGQTTYSEYSYDANLTTNTDGDFAQFSFCEGPATDYRNDGCTIKAATLPAELIQFDATPNGNKVVLDWITATEINVNQHVVQRSSDGEVFSDILSVNAKGNSSVNTYYKEIDYQPLDGVSYYRLKTVDFDDSFELSPARIVRFENNDPIVLYGYNEWIVSNQTKDKYTYTLYNVLGEIIGTSTTVSSKEEKVSISHQALPNGVYFINISSRNFKKSIKVIK